MFDFLKPQKGRPRTWRRLCWLEHALHCLVYDLLPVRRCAGAIGADGGT